MLAKLVAAGMILLLGIAIMVVVIMSLPSDVKSGTIDSVRFYLYPKEDGKVLLVLDYYCGRGDDCGRKDQILALLTEGGAEVEYYVISVKRGAGGFNFQILKYGHGRITADCWSGEVMEYAEAMKHAESLFVEWMAKIQKAEEEASQTGNLPA